MAKDIKVNDPFSHAFEEIEQGGGQAPIDKKGYLIGKFGENQSSIKRIGLFSDDTYDENLNSTGISIKFNIDSTKVYNSSGQDITSEFEFDSNGERTNKRNDEQVISLCLTELDYCDTNGNEKKILVLASKPYDLEEG